MLTVLPDFTQTIIIFACFPNDEKGKIFLDEIEVLNDYHFSKTITSLLIFFAENTFLSPLLWKKLGKRKQNILCRKLEQSVLMGLTKVPKKFQFSSLNLFDKQYSFERLKTNNP